MCQKLFLYTILAFCSLKTTAQDAPTDTVELARSLAYEKKFNEADQLLTIYNASGQNVYGLWLQAQVAYWKNEIARSEELYAQAINAFPEENGLKLSFGKMLWEAAQFKKARTQLENFLLSAPGHIEATMLLAYLDYWNSHTANAKKRLVGLLEREPENVEAQKLYAEISGSSAPVVALELQNLSDDQVLRSNTFNAKANWNKSGLFSPGIQVYKSAFSLDTKGESKITSGLQVGNIFRLNYGKTTLNIEGGVFNADSRAFFTGSLRLLQKLPANLYFDINASRQPYQFTLASIRTPFTFTTMGAALGYNKQDKWLAQTGYLIQGFNDGNKIGALYGWLLFPVINRSVIVMHGGYSFNYANAEKNAFVPIQTMTAVAATQSLYSRVAGVYNPYFTPQEQTVHALLASVKGNLSKAVNLRIKGSVGVWAEAQNPYLMLDEARNSYFINKFYSPQKYTPIELESKLQINMQRKVSLSVAYLYSSLFFYNRHQGNFGLSYRFIK